MNTEIRFLQQLEDDLHEAAAREGRQQIATPRPRRLPRRGPHWGAVVAAFIMALLVVAGGIGFLTQNGGLGSDSADSVVDPLTVPDIRAGAQASASPGFDGFAPGDQRSLNQGTVGDTATAAKTANLPNPANVPTTDLSKIIRDGSIGIELADGAFTQNVSAVTRIATSQGGIVLSSASENDTAGTFTLRIPAKHFDEVIQRLRALGDADGARVLYQDTTGQDVTAGYVDLKARLRILEGTKARLTSLQAKATTVSEILSLGARLDQVQLQIEQIQGQLNVINGQVAESTVKVELREKDAPAVDPSEPVTRPSLGSAWQRAVQGFLRVVGAVIVGLGYLIPLGLIALAAWSVLTLARRQRRAAS